MSEHVPVGPFDFHVSPDDMRAAGRVVTAGSDEWQSDLAVALRDRTPGFGADRFADLVRSFHTKTHGRSMDYYGEVGHAAGDVGTGLAKMAELYELVEADAVSRASAVVKVVEITGEVGLL